MSRRKIDREMDEMTKLLLEHGVYSLRKSEDAIDKKILKMLKSSEKRIYRFWIGVFYGIIILVSLSWLPLFGPMIAGYVAGRRAGSPTKGTLAGAIIVTLFYLFQNPFAISNLPLNLMSARDSILSTIGSHVHWLIPAISFIRAYTTPTITVLSGQIAYTPQTYTIILVFAYIGGTLAKQKREEIRLMAMSRIFSHISVYPVHIPSPHHSAIPSYRVNAPSFEDFERAKFKIDSEMDRIYRNEYEIDVQKKGKRTKRSGKIRKKDLVENLAKPKKKHRMETL